MSHQRSIIARMLYIIRIRRMCRVVFDEINHPTGMNKASVDPNPTDILVLKKFKKVYRYDDDTALITLTMATRDADEYLSLEKSTDSRVPMRRVAIKGQGLKLIKSRAFFINELAGSVGKVAPIL